MALGGGALLSFTRRARPQPARSETREAAGMTCLPKATRRGSEGLYKDGSGLTDAAGGAHAISSWEHMQLNRKDGDYCLCQSF